MILLLGPYFGSFEYEVTTFRPYALWLSRTLEWDKLYVSTHFNRMFLYDEITSNQIPIYKHLSINEMDQQGYIHRKQTLKDFNAFIRDVKYIISEREKCSKRDIEVLNVGYTKTIQHFPIYKKIFEKVNTDCINTPEELKNHILFIPHTNDPKERGLYESMSNMFMVIGNTGCHLKKRNVILRRVDYSENGIKYILGMITHAKGVICPLSYWTLLCNMQGVPVFSWGNNPGQYKEDGIYTANINRRSRILSDLDLRSLSSSLKCFIEDVNGR